MFQKGRGEQPIKYKEEVLKIYPTAKWVMENRLRSGAIMVDNKRISEVYRVAWQAWESAYNVHKNDSLKELFKY